MGNATRVGGQVSLDTDAGVLDPDDVLKAATFYQGTLSGDELHRILMVRSDSYTALRQATTGIPMQALVCPQMVIEIEAIAVLGS